MIGVSVSDECPPGVQGPVDTEPLVIGVSVSDECPPGVQCLVEHLGIGVQLLFFHGGF